jgi:outer membrane protein TolC
MKALALLAALVAPAASAGFLPDDAAALAAIDALPGVRAAEARSAESGARAEALRRGPYGLELSLTPLARHEQLGRTYSEWEVGVSRSLRLPGKARIDEALGQAGVAAADSGLAEARHSGARLLLARWCDWLRTAALAELAANQRAVLEAEGGNVARRVGAGDLATLDLERAAAALAQGELAAERTRLEREQSRLALAAQFPALTLPAGVPAIPEPAPADADEERIVESILARNHEIEIAEAAVRRQALLAERADAERRPDPKVGLRVVDEADHGEQAVGLVLTLPLAASGSRATALAEQRLASALEAEAAGVRQRLTLEARQLARAVTGRHEAWQAARRALAATSAALRRTERAWQLGEIGFNDLALARRAEQDAASSEITARLDALEARLQLEIDSHARWSGPGEGASLQASLPTRPHSIRE